MILLVSLTAEIYFTGSHPSVHTQNIHTYLKYLEMAAHADIPESLLEVGCDWSKFNDVCFVDTVHTYLSFSLSLCPCLFALCLFALCLFVSLSVVAVCLSGHQLACHLEHGNFVLRDIDAAHVLLLRAVRLGPPPIQAQALNMLAQISVTRGDMVVPSTSVPDTKENTDKISFRFFPPAYELWARESIRQLLLSFGGGRRIVATRLPRCRWLGTCCLVARLLRRAR